MQLEQFFKLTAGFTGADIKNMVNLACIKAVRNHKDKVSEEELNYALERIKLGVRKNKSSLDTDLNDLQVTATREIGVALYSILKKTNQEIFKVTILPSGDELGFSSFLPQESEIS